MSNEKEKQHKLSYESDGIMGHNRPENPSEQNQNNEMTEEFFNVTQNSE
ncbi:hypothetical protein [Schinkia azotoformans]|nr:hypothetical protein [Schinkia azotoformans]MEC1721373.1 hypothetical protein [Schinkia azotoformans]MED4414520.1 hypothetical protein [Schinkia azotoformans]